MDLWEWSGERTEDGWVGLECAWGTAMQHSDRSEDAEFPSSCRAPSIACIIDSHPIDPPASHLCALPNCTNTSLVCVLFSLSTEDRRKQGNREEVGKTKNYRSWIPKKPPLCSKFSNYKTPWGPTESREAERREGATAKYYRSVALLHISFKHTVFKNECILRLYFKINDRTCFFNSWTASFSWKLDLFLRYLKLCD